MPLDRTRQIEGGTVGIGVHDAPSPTFLESLGAAFRQENLILSALTDAKQAFRSSEFYKVDQSYNVFDDVEGFEDEAKNGAFDRVYNRDAANP